MKNWDWTYAIIFLCISVGCTAFGTFIYRFLKDVIISRRTIKEHEKRMREVFDNQWRK